jgi:hypothetical protein
VNREPVLIIAAIMSVVYAVAEFGVDLTDRQTVAIEAVLVAVGALWARSKVSPTG